MKTETALISVSNKHGVVDLARQLTALGIRILSTGGTARTLKAEGIPVTRVSEYTGFPEILDGRVKTLHPKIHGGILARHDDEGHRSVLEQQGILPIGLVVVNLYPFVETISKEGVTREEAIEQIDIGGPSMIRAAAKNLQSVTVVVDPADYGAVTAELNENACCTTAATRLRLAGKAFEHTAAYDTAISEYFATITGSQESVPAAMHLNLTRQATLRYGENPHQKAAIYRQGTPPQGLAAARQLQGKELSFNNYLDLESTWSLCQEFQAPFCAIIKHTNPCGASCAGTLAEAYRRALACDPVAAFGSVIGFNRCVDRETAEEMSSLFVEAVIAPSYDKEALEVFGEKKGLRVMEMGVGARAVAQMDFKKISGGFLVQDKDLAVADEGAIKTVTSRSASEVELRDLLFAMRICKHVKSNAIVYARDEQTVGVGAGQMSRVDSARLAAQKARLPLAGCVMASDAFFPFRDGIDEAAKAGVTAVIQPGGSVRDEEVVQAANEHGMAMLFTGMRHFKH
jgi:phosphoribosylaminoimidazolecarboxamide formyltransferase/IMP cyclohydrolase